jgi:hypothetical protein
MTELLRPDGLVHSHVAVVPPGATTIYLGQDAVDGVDLTEAYPVTAAALEGAAPPVVVGLAVPGALVEVSAVAAVTA